MVLDDLSPTQSNPLSASNTHFCPPGHDRVTSSQNTNAKQLQTSYESGNASISLKNLHHGQHNHQNTVPVFSSTSNGNLESHLNFLQHEPSPRDQSNSTRGVFSVDNGQSLDILGQVSTSQISLLALPTSVEPAEEFVSQKISDMTGSSKLASSNHLWGLTFDDVMRTMGALPFTTVPCISDSSQIILDISAESYFEGAPQSDQLLSTSPVPFRRLVKSFGGHGTSSLSSLTFGQRQAQLHPRRHSTSTDKQHRLNKDPHKILPIGQGLLCCSSKSVSKLNKGGRIGPLSDQQRGQAAKSRKEKSVCIRCRKDKQPVSLRISLHNHCQHHQCREGIPCMRCLALGNTTAWQQPCTKAHFIDVVESGACNYICE